MDNPYFVKSNTMNKGLNEQAEPDKVLAGSEADIEQGCTRDDIAIEAESAPEPEVVVEPDDETSQPSKSEYHMPTVIIVSAVAGALIGSWLSGR